MQQKPRGREDSVFSGGLLGTILLRGLLIGFCTLGAYTATAARGGSLEACRTAALLTLIFTQLIHCFECKSERRASSLCRSGTTPAGSGGDRVGADGGVLGH